MSKKEIEKLKEKVPESMRDFLEWLLTHPREKHTIGNALRIVFTVYYAHARGLTLEDFERMSGRRVRNYRYALRKYRDFLKWKERDESG